MSSVQDDSLEATLLHTIGAWSSADSSTESTTSEAAGTVELEPGATVGRYTVLGQLGTGAMGVVFEAFDRDLDRRVAVKLLKRGSSDALLSEAQAMAKLAHAHVVTVYDVGSVRVGGEARVFVAMEYVGGGTLGDWLRAAPRSHEEIVGVFLAAGEGLAAAHRAALVHRDFKPDNVLMTGEGSPKVTDFGLAHSTREVLAERRSEPHDLRALEGVALEGSEADTMPDPTIRPKARFCGTPAYMAPEQFRGRDASERSDQFSFCVALYEALYGRRPYSGATLVSLGLAVCQGRRQPPPRDVAVARRIVEVLDRGLATEPDDRFPDMDSLLAALRPPAPKRSPVGALAIAAIGVVAGLGLGYGVLTEDEPERVDPCVDAAASVDALWSGDARARLRTAIEATEVVGAEAVAAGLDTELGKYAAALRGARVAACERRVEQRDSPRIDEHRTLCIDAREQALAGLLVALARIEPGQVEHLPTAAAKLPAIAACNDANRLLMDVAPPRDEQAEEVAALRRELAEVRPAIAAKAPGANEAAAGVAERARDLAYLPLTAEALLVEGYALVAAEQLDESAIVLEQAYLDALRVGHDTLAGEAAGQLVFVVGVELGDAVAGQRWANHGLAVAERAEDPRAHASVLGSLAVLDRIAGKLELAVAHAKQVVELLEDELGPEHLETGRAYGNYGVALIASGQPAAGLGWLERAASIFEAKYGSNHTRLAPLYLNLAAARVGLDDPAELDRAKQDLERALAIHTANHGSDKDVAFVRSGLADVAVRQGQRELAREHREFVVEAFRAYYGEVHPIVAGAELGLALSCLQAGEHERGKALVERVFATIAAHDTPADLSARARMIAGALALAAGDEGGAEALAQGWKELSAIPEATADAELLEWLDANPKLDPR